MLRGRRYRRLGKGIYVDANTAAGHVQAVQAALLCQPPSAWASHLSAARVYGIPVPEDPRVHVSVLRPNDRPRGDPVCGCTSGSTRSRCELLDGVRVPAPEQVFVELAALLPLVDLVVAGDAMVRRGWCTPVQLVAHCRSSRHDHARPALEAAGYVRADVDSPMESRLRMLLVLAGFPEPTVNFKIRDETGHVVMRFDLSFPEARVIVEYDGRQHADSAAQHDRDLARREEIDGMKWRIVVVTSPGIYSDPERTLRRVRDVLLERRLPGVPTRFDDAWRAHFPGRGTDPR